jgi:hypothetical protein
VQSGLENPRHDLHTTGDAGRRGDREGDAFHRYSGLACDPCGDRVSGQGAPLEHEHPAQRLFAICELGKQLALDPRLRAKWPGPHREESFGIDRPSGVLRCHAGDSRMVGPHLHASPGFAGDRHRRERHVAQAAHAQLRERAPCLETTAYGDTGVEHTRAAGRRVDAEVQFDRA